MEAYVNLRLYRQCMPSSDDVQYHKDLTLETLEMLVDNDIDWGMIATHSNFTEKWLLNFPDKPWNWSKLHKHPKFDFDWVYVFLNKPWDWRRLSALATIPLLRQYPIFPWDWEVVTCSSEISTIEMVKNSDLPWVVYNMHFNEVDDDDIEFLHMFEEDLDWSSISENASLRIVRQNMDLPWFHYVISLEDDCVITQDDLDFLHETSDDYTWNWARLSFIVPFELIAKNQHMEWEPELLSSNPTVTYDDVQNNPGLPWDTTFTPCEPIDRIVRRWVAANLIKRTFKVSISNPMYKLCRDRLANEFKNITI